MESNFKHVVMSSSIPKVDILWEGAIGFKQSLPEGCSPHYVTKGDIHNLLQVDKILGEMQSILWQEGNESRKLHACVGGVEKRTKVLLQPMWRRQPRPMLEVSWSKGWVSLAFYS